MSKQNTHRNDMDDITPPDVIDNVFKSMNKIMEKLMSDNLLINESLKQVKNDLKIVYESHDKVWKLVNADRESRTKLLENFSSICDEKINQITSKLDEFNRTTPELSEIQQVVQQLKDDMYEKLVQLQEELDPSQYVGQIKEARKEVMEVRSTLIKFVEMHMDRIRRENEKLNRDIEEFKQFTTAKALDGMRDAIRAMVDDEVKQAMRESHGITNKLAEMEAKQQRQYANAIRLMQTEMKKIVQSTTAPGIAGTPITPITPSTSNTSTAIVDQPNSPDSTHSNHIPVSHSRLSTHGSLSDTLIKSLHQ